jgi:Skp family chaperone for outer membrane proteins
MKTKINITLALSLLTLAYLTVERFSMSKNTRIGVVQMEKLVYEFRGMKEATKKYTDKMSRWGTESDSLEKRLAGLYEQIRIDSAGSDRKKLAKDIHTFRILNRSYQEHLQNTRTNAEKEDQQMTLGVINQLNEYMAFYAKKEGFDVILCNNPQQPGVGYSREAIDITGDVLQFANQTYEGIK